MRYQGKIAKWKDDQGFGFITPSGGGKQVFVHIKSFANRHRRPIESDIVTYQLGTDAKGRAQAERVAFVGVRLLWGTSPEPNYASLTFAGIFLGFLAGMTFFGKAPIPILGLYIVASVVAFSAYAHDKSAARNGQWRTSESTLHLIALIGGWPGAAVAQSLIRHKSKKQSFQIEFWMTAILNCAALVWLFTPSGTAVLQSISDLTRTLTAG